MSRAFKETTTMVAYPMKPIEHPMFWRSLLISVLIGAVTLLFAGTASAVWKEPVGGDSPINVQADKSADSGPSTTVWNGQPYVTWSEDDGDNKQIRVKRFDGSSWVTVGSNQINYSGAAGMHAVQPTIAASGDLLVVAWVEFDGVNYELRAAKYNAIDDTWVATGSNAASPINYANNRNASEPSITFFGGSIPTVAWAEDDGVNKEIRVAIFLSGNNSWGKLNGANALSPINYKSDKNATSPTVVSYGNTLYVGSVEVDGANVSQTRVAKYNPNNATWNQVGPVLGPVNNDLTKSSVTPDLVAIGSGPSAGLYIAWSEQSALAQQIRVSRLTVVNGNEQFIQVISGASPINYQDNMNATGPSLANIGGTLYVSWSEFDAAGKVQVRVAKLNETAGDWQAVVGGQRPINASADTWGVRPRLFSLGGVPYVAWREGVWNGGPTVFQVRVSRLEPDFLDTSSVPTDKGALVTQKLKTYGVAYPLKFEYGPAQGFGSQTDTVLTSGSSGNDTVSAQIEGLEPVTQYSWRAYGDDGLSPFAMGPTSSFTTLTQPTKGEKGDPGDDGLGGGNGSSGTGLDGTSGFGQGLNGLNGVSGNTAGLVGGGASSSKLKVAFLKRAVSSKVGTKKVVFRYSLSRAATVKFQIKKGSKVVAQIVRKLKKGGKYNITWNGKVKVVKKKGKRKVSRSQRATKGTYSAVITATAGSARSTDRARVTLKAKKIKKR